MADGLGDRMKDYESRETERRFLPLLPIYARIDGRCFSRFTHGMERPFDPAFADIMLDVTRCLVSETGAIVGYTQSDEISLLWHSDDPKSEMFLCQNSGIMAQLHVHEAAAPYSSIVSIAYQSFSICTVKLISGP